MHEPIEGYEAGRKGRAVERWTPEAAWTGATGSVELERGEDWNDRNAEALAYASMWAYSPPREFVNRLSGYGFGDDLEAYDIQVRNSALLLDTTVYFVRAGEVGIVVFRGTEPTDVVDLLTDVSVLLTEFPYDGEQDSHVHRGFYRATSSVRSEIEFRLQDSGVRALYIAGHSLGGALAMLLAAELHARGHVRARQADGPGPELRGVYTYGQPMVGDGEFVRWYERMGLDTRTFRHVRDRDVVTRVPPAWSGPYRHAGREYRCHVRDDDRGLYWKRHEGDPVAPFPGPASWALGQGLVAYYVRRAWGRAGRKLAQSALFAVTLDAHFPDLYVIPSEASRVAPSAHRKPMAYEERDGGGLRELGLA